MKSILAGAVAAALIAHGACAMLDAKLPQSADRAPAGTVRP